MKMRKAFLIVAILATSYTGFLFAQGRGRDLWQGPFAPIDLIAQSAAAGPAAVVRGAAPHEDPARRDPQRAAGGGGDGGAGVGAQELPGR